MLVSRTYFACLSAMMINKTPMDGTADGINGITVKCVCVGLNIYENDKGKSHTMETDSQYFFCVGHNPVVSFFLLSFKTR